MQAALVAAAAALVDNPQAVEAVALMLVARVSLMGPTREALVVQVVHHLALCSQVVQNAVVRPRPQGAGGRALGTSCTHGVSVAASGTRLSLKKKWKR